MDGRFFQDAPGAEADLIGGVMFDVRECIFHGVIRRVGLRPSGMFGLGVSPNSQNYTMLAASAKGKSNEFPNDDKLSKNTPMLSLDTKLQASKTESDIRLVAICGRGRRQTYEESNTNGQDVRELLKEKQGVVHCGTIAWGGEAIKRNKNSANLALGYQGIWIDALCIIRNDGTGWVKEAKPMAQHYRNAVCTLGGLSLGIENSCLANNSRRFVMHGTCDYRVPKGLVTNLEYLASGMDCVNVQETSAVNIQGSPAITIQDSAEAEEECVADSNATCSTAVSEKTNIFSNSENDPAAGPEISHHYDFSSSTSQSWQEVPLRRMGQTSPANICDIYGSCKPELQVIEPVAPGFEDPHPSANGRFGGCSTQELPILSKDTPHSEETILRGHKGSALRDFMENPAHRYWTWCAEHQNWWHEDEKTNARIWAPLDFD